MKQAPSLKCILCAQLLAFSIEDDGHGERPDLLICSRHSDRELHAAGLAEEWKGLASDRPASFFTGSRVGVSGAWEQGRDGIYGLYVLLHSGELLMFVTLGGPKVEVLQVALQARILCEPAGLSRCIGTPWGLAAATGWEIKDARRLDDDRVLLSFTERGIVVFSTDYYSWRELGDGRYFLRQDWYPGATSVPS